MAIVSTTIWEVRATGNVFNGAGFNPANANVGTDYSQQDTAQLTVTDGVGNTTTTITSATGGFTAAMVGNLIGIVNSGNTFVGYFEIISVTNTNTIVVDSTLANGSSYTIRVGGASNITSSGLPPINSGGPNGHAVAGNKCWVRSGTYILNVNQPTLSIVGTQVLPFTLEGYTTTRGDGAPTPPVIQANGTLNAVEVSGTNNIVKNITFDGTNSGQNTVLVDGSFNTLVNVQGKNGQAALVISGNMNKITQGWFKTPGASQPCIVVTGFGNLIEYNVVSGAPSAAGIALRETANDNCIRQNAIYGNNLDGIDYIPSAAGGIQIIGNALWNNGRDGIRIESTGDGLRNFHVEQNIFGKNVGYDINYTVSDQSAIAATKEMLAVQFECNAFYTTGLGRLKNLAGDSGVITLTTSPFISDTDFHLNDTPGGGAVVIASPCTPAFADGTNGATVTPGPLGYATISSSNIVTVRSLWREWTNEKTATVPTDSTVDIYIDSGLQALNRRVRYNYKDDNSFVVFVAGTQEYTLPTDCIEVIFVEWNSQELQKRDIEDWRRKGENWRRERTGEPLEWAMYGNKLVILPTPDAAAVALAASPVIRYVATPPALSLGGLTQLATQDFRIAVYYGVAEWSVAYPNSALAAQRGAEFMKKFDTEAQGIAKYYQDRLVAR